MYLQSCLQKLNGLSVPNPLYFTTVFIMTAVEFLLFLLTLKLFSHFLFPIQFDILGEQFLINIGQPEEQAIIKHSNNGQKLLLCYILIQGDIYESFHYFFIYTDSFMLRLF